MPKKIILVVAFLILFFARCAWKQPPEGQDLQLPERDSTYTIKSPLTVETLVGLSGTNYTFIYKNSAKIDFEISRPSEKDTTVYLSIAGAFTTLDSFRIDGLYICKGKTGNKKKINRTLGGAIKIMNGECEIFPTEKGSILKDSLINLLEKNKGSLFQQIQCITNGSPAHYKDVNLFQRRGVAIMKNGKIAVVGSNKMITLKTFSDDLAALQVYNLLYTDMGNWDEGWYKSDGKTIIMGHYLSQTDKQCNWVVFRK